MNARFAVFQARCPYAAQLAAGGLRGGRLRPSALAATSVLETSVTAAVASPAAASGTGGMADSSTSGMGTSGISGTGTSEIAGGGTATPPISAEASAAASSASPVSLGTGPMSWIGGAGAYLSKNRSSSTGTGMTRVLFFSAATSTTVCSSLS